MEPANNAVYLHYDQAALDRAYDQRAWADNADAMLERFRILGEAALLAAPDLMVSAYGQGADETQDIFPTTAGSAIHVHIHGGGWRNQSKRDAAFLATAGCAAGLHTVVPDFSQLPGVKLPEMVDQLARAVGWVWRNAASFGGDPARIILSGHSSGAHLAAVLLTLDWTAHNLPAGVIKAAILVSGIYDMEPVMLSARRTYIVLEDGEAERLSPIRHTGLIGCPVTLLHGSGESVDFTRQTLAFDAALASAGVQVRTVLIPNVNHYEINEGFAMSDSPVFQALLSARDGL